MSIQPTDRNNLISIQFGSVTKKSSTDTDAVSSDDSGSTVVAKTVIGGETNFRLTDMDSQLKNAEDVDWKKVSDIKQQLAKGSLNIDLDALSKAIVEMHNA